MVAKLVWYFFLGEWPFFIQNYSWSFWGINQAPRQVGVQATKNGIEDDRNKKKDQFEWTLGQLLFLIGRYFDLGT